MEKLYYIAGFVLFLFTLLTSIQIQHKKEQEKQKQLRATNLQRCCELEIDCEFCPNNCFKD